MRLSTHTHQTQWCSVSFWGAVGQFTAALAMLAFDAPIMIIPGFIPMFFSNATIGVFAIHFGGWKAVMKIRFCDGHYRGGWFSLKRFTYLRAIRYWPLSLTAGWGMADWALVFPPIMQGISSSSMFFFVVVALAGAGAAASKALRAEEDGEAQTSANHDSSNSRRRKAGG
ncbi:hypothetical protein OK016_26395 [Vibrio chagasii]|nr:hypothetical protein [Vibrio chagasii]